ncbi:unknown protein [Seminavis robusta]|uniref:Uncharacterized protein n=1 Tax=Seminavis robusta TaxID=568900 RepID=A0A9N8DI07_9STRA|nr:unknown protein [Seminavis robusta]|eukprot:Sro132_g062470.1 n/a (281) ;mRNA; r:22841-23683
MLSPSLLLLRRHGAVKSACRCFSSQRDDTGLWMKDFEGKEPYSMAVMGPNLKWQVVEKGRNTQMDEKPATFGARICSRKDLGTNVQITPEILRLADRKTTRNLFFEIVRDEVVRSLGVPLGFKDKVTIFNSLSTIGTFEPYDEDFPTRLRWNSHGLDSGSRKILEYLGARCRVRSDDIYDPDFFTALDLTLPNLPFFRGIKEQDRGWIYEAATNAHNKGFRLEWAAIHIIGYGPDGTCNQCEFSKLVSPQLHLPCFEGEDRFRKALMEAFEDPGSAREDE